LATVLERQFSWRSEPFRVRDYLMQRQMKDELRTISETQNVSLSAIDLAFLPIKKAITEQFTGR
jgi:hypothetical protein